MVGRWSQPASPSRAAALRRGSTGQLPDHAQSTASSVTSSAGTGSQDQSRVVPPTWLRIHQLSYTPSDSFSRTSGISALRRAHQPGDRGGSGLSPASRASVRPPWATDASPLNEQFFTLSAWRQVANRRRERAAIAERRRVSSPNAGNDIANHSVAADTTSNYTIRCSGTGASASKPRRKYRSGKQETRTLSLAGGRPERRRGARRPDSPPRRRWATRDRRIADGG